MINVIKIYEENDIKCQLGVDMESYNFIAEVKETQSLTSGYLYECSDDALKAMNKLKNEINELINAECKSWFELSNKLKHAIEQSENNNLFINNALLKKLVIHFITSYLGDDVKETLENIPLIQSIPLT